MGKAMRPGASARRGKAKRDAEAGEGEEEDAVDATREVKRQRIETRASGGGGGVASARGRQSDGGSAMRCMRRRNPGRCGRDGFAAVERLATRGPLRSNPTVENQMDDVA
uniref:Uncharacterized protein n=1 Tax=Oryza meridionalis TaxID=40149 RepID=A0A0E0C3W7_9ORYZ